MAGRDRGPRRAGQAEHGRPRPEGGAGPGDGVRLLRVLGARVVERAVRLAVPDRCARDRCDLRQRVDLGEDELLEVGGPGRHGTPSEALAVGVRHVRSDDDAAQRLMAETGKRGVPYILVNDKHWVRGYHREARGKFDPGLLIQELAQAL